jgi:hypothetical protein
MTDHTRTPLTGSITGPLTGDAEIDAVFAEIDALLEEWDLLIDEQLATARRMRDLAAVEEEWSC